MAPVTSDDAQYYLGNLRGFEVTENTSKKYATWPIKALLSI